MGVVDGKIAAHRLGNKVDCAFNARAGEVILACADDPRPVRPLARPSTQPRTYTTDSHCFREGGDVCAHIWLPTITSVS
jgi:hypothetical protein